jgi:hypothetical protein
MFAHFIIIISNGSVPGGPIYHFFLKNYSETLFSDHSIGLPF